MNKLKVSTREPGLIVFMKLYNTNNEQIEILVSILRGKNIECASVLGIFKRDLVDFFL